MFKVDFIDGTPVTWELGHGGVEASRNRDYRPTFYVDADRDNLTEARVWLHDNTPVNTTGFEEHRPTLQKPKTTVLRADAPDHNKLKTAVNFLKKEFGLSTFRFYNVGFSPQFRYCLQTDTCPKPSDLSRIERLDIHLHRKHLANEDISRLYLDGDRAGGTENQALDAVESELEGSDLIVVNRGQVLELLNRKIEEYEKDFSLGRTGELQTLARENTVSSYGRTVHSASRFNIPGRIVIDRSNSFLLDEATVEGLWGLVERSHRPMQELAWGSIGRLLTSIEVKQAYEQGILTPWKNWEPEKPKKASTIHKADRGGFIFNPEPEIHRDVYEADFASLFPNIMRHMNISPETVRCDCCNNNAVPELDYTICEEQEGFIGRVLAPLIDDRQEMKEALRREDLSEEQERYLQGSVDAIKWILVSCFGYMGHAHASYGAIRCHQAIQAYDRSIMVKTKEMFEESGFSVAHGIIDSIWVQPSENHAEFQKVCGDITGEIGIELEPEHRFEWCAFVPRSSDTADIATLNRYFGKKQDGEFKTAGIEAEQDSKPEFVQESQMQMIEALDQRMKPQDVIEVLKHRISRLEAGRVEPEKLVEERRASKSLEAYQVENRTVSALKRARLHGLEMKPGQAVRYVVRDDKADSLERTRLAFEADGVRYDPSYYRTELVRAAESVLSPLGIDRASVRDRLEGMYDPSLRTLT